MNMEKFHFLLEEEAIDCKANMLHQYRDKYWIVHPIKGLAFFRKGYGSPQCNSNEELAKRLCPDWGIVKFIPRVLVPLNINDYMPIRLSPHEF